MYSCLFLEDASVQCIQNNAGDKLCPQALARQLEEELKKKKSVFKICQQEKDGLGSRILSLDYQIKPKMFVKITNWMQKICQQTLNFSLNTLQISIRLLIRYLNIKEISPKQLQMLGCVCLHLASKINQRTIIAIESYMDCCLGIFTKQQFIALEKDVYQSLNHSLSPTINLHQLVQLACFQILGVDLHEEVESKISHLTIEMMKDLEFSKFSIISICSMMLVEIGMNKDKILAKEDLLCGLIRQSRHDE